MITVPARLVLAVPTCLLAACSLVACSSPPEGPPAASPTPAPVTSRPSSTVLPTTDVSATSTTAADPGGQLPGDLVPNVLDDECLLTADELGALVGRTGMRGDNTELAGGGARRSCFYAPEVADDPVARIDVYSSSSLPPPELVARIAANGGRALTGVGQGAVVVTGQDGATELVVASPSLLAVLTVLPGGAAVPPPDQAFAVAGMAIAGRLPR